MNASPITFALRAELRKVSSQLAAVEKRLSVMPKGTPNWSALAHQRRALAARKADLVRKLASVARNQARAGGQASVQPSQATPMSLLRRARLQAARRAARVSGQPSVMSSPLAVSPSVTLDRYVRLAYPWAKKASESGHPPDSAARFGAARVNTPGHFMGPVVERVTHLLQRTRRPGRFLPWLFGGQGASAASTASTASTYTPSAPTAPSGAYMPGAILGTQYQSGAFQFAPNVVPVTGMEQMAQMGMDAGMEQMPPVDGDVPMDDLLLEEDPPFYQRPVFLLGAAGLGYFLWSRKKKGKKGAEKAA